MTKPVGLSAAADERVREIAREVAMGRLVDEDRVRSIAREVYQEEAPRSFKDAVASYIWQIFTAWFMGVILGSLTAYWVWS